MVPGAPAVVDDALRELAAVDGPLDLDRALAPLSTGGRGQLIEAVRRHRLDAAFADALQRAGHEVPVDIAADVDDDRLLRLQVTAALGRVAEVLDRADVPWLTFKGPVIAALMARPELRTYNDLDVLVGATDLGPAVEALIAAGVDELNENWVPYVRHRVGEVPMAAGSVSVDLHWHVIGLGHHRRSIRFDPTAMLARRRPVELAGASRPTFDASDELLHLVVHAALSGATRLDQLRDIAVVVANDDVDWSEFTQRAGGVGVARLAGHTLDRAARVLGAPVSDPVLRRMAGSSLDRRRRFDGHAVGDLRGIGVWWRRDRATASAGAALRRIVDVATRIPGRRHGWDFTDENSRLYHARATGGPAVRSEYFRRVADWV